MSHGTTSMTIVMRNTTTETGSVLTVYSGSLRTSFTGTTMGPGGPRGQGGVAGRVRTRMYTLYVISVQVSTLVTSHTLTNKQTQRLKTHTCTCVHYYVNTIQFSSFAHYIQCIVCLVHWSFWLVYSVRTCMLKRSLLFSRYREKAGSTISFMVLVLILRPVTDKIFAVFVNTKQTNSRKLIHHENFNMHCIRYTVAIHNL